MKFTRFQVTRAKHNASGYYQSQELRPPPSSAPSLLRKGAERTNSTAESARGSTQSVGKGKHYFRNLQKNARKSLRKPFRANDFKKLYS